MNKETRPSVWSTIKHGLKSYAIVQGRASQREYGLMMFVYFILFLLFFPAGYMVLEKAYEVLPVLILPAIIICCVIALFILVGCVVVGIRRAHDMGWAGWWGVLLVLMPLFYIGLIIILLFAKGEPVPNMYGKAPRY